MRTLTAREEALVVDDVNDAIDYALHALEDVALHLRDAERMAPGTRLAEAIAHFRAYHAADLEGADFGWLAGPYLVDALRKLKEGDWA